MWYISECWDSGALGTIEVLLGAFNRLGAKGLERALRGWGDMLRRRSLFLLRLMSPGCDSWCCHLPLGHLDSLCVKALSVHKDALFRKKRKRNHVRVVTNIQMVWKHRRVADYTPLPPWAVFPTWGDLSVIQYIYLTFSPTFHPK